MNLRARLLRVTLPAALCLLIASTICNAANLTPAANAVVHAGVYDDVTISNTGIVLKNVTIMGTLDVNEDLTMVNCYHDTATDASVALEADNTITMENCIFATTEAETADSGTVTDTNCTFDTDCNLTDDYLPMNPACWRITE